MLVFSCEFPANPEKGVDDLFGVLIGWVVGSPHYPWKSPSEFMRPTNDIVEYSKEGHSISLGFFCSDSSEIGGIRHHWLENNSREWTTEVSAIKQNRSLWVTIKLFCDLLRTGMTMPIPKKPYIIKKLFQGLGGGQDGPLLASDRPYFLKLSDSELAVKIVSGQIDSHNLEVEIR